MISRKQYVSAILECENAFICAIWTHKTKRKTGNMVYKYFSAISYHSERLLRISTLRKHPFCSAFNIVWMNPYHRTMLRQPVLCKLWTNPLMNSKFYAKRWKVLKRAFDWYTAIPTLELVRHSLFICSLILHRYRYRYQQRSLVFLALI